MIFTLLYWQNSHLFPQLAPINTYPVYPLYNFFTVSVANYLKSQIYDQKYC